ncbi:Uncharacterised protein [uncultured archaeon]|nr:Uncharacterised protein [uncultured archaeon]
MVTMRLESIFSLDDMIGSTSSSSAPSVTNTHDDAGNIWSTFSSWAATFLSAL